MRKSLPHSAGSAPFSVSEADAFGPSLAGLRSKVTGTVRAEADGTLRIEPTAVKKITEPKDPYEY